MFDCDSSTCYGEGLPEILLEIPEYFLPENGCQPTGLIEQGLEARNENCWPMAHGPTLTSNTISLVCLLPKPLLICLPSHLPMKMTMAETECQFRSIA